MTRHSRARPAALRFPGFVWGAATSAYQIEGATQGTAAATSIWDTFARTPGGCTTATPATSASDHYHR